MPAAGSWLILAAQLAIVTAWPTATKHDEVDLSQMYPFERAFGGRVFELTAPTRTPSTWKEVCGDIYTGATRGYGAAYYWCGHALKVPEIVGYSYGVHSWDTWSRYLGDEHRIETRLYDCFKTPTDGSAKPIPQYKTQYTRFDVCLAAEAHTDNDGRRFEAISSHLEDHKPLSTMVKIDIEGMEWEIIKSMTADDFSKIVQLDFEIHFCMRGAEDWDMVAEQLARLNEHFEVVDRMFDPIGQNRSIGCRWALPPVIPPTSMFSVSYVSKAFLRAKELGRSKKSTDVVAETPPPRKAGDTGWSVDFFSGGTSGELMAATPKRKIAFAKALERFTRASIQVSEVRCGGIETGASRGAGAGYFWCKNVLTGTPNPVGLSYGISSWDTWSRYLANEWKVKTQLYDCVLDGSGHSKFAQYDVPYTRSPVCLGVKEATVDGRQFETLGSHLKGVPALGAFVKIDIEGDEWKALAATSDSDLAKIALLDLELHWCLLHQKDSLDTIILTLKRLLKQFEVVGRLVEGDWLHGVGCGRFPLQTSMMSVSYVNKAALLGRIVIENTEPHPRRSTEEWCRGLTVATSRNGAFKWCNRLLDQVVDGNPVAISAGGAQDSGNWSSILSGVHDTPTRSIRSLPSDDVGATVLGQLQHELQGSKPSSAIVKLDLDGHEWHVLSGLLDEDGNGSTSALDKIAMLDVGMSFCHESTPHRQMVAHVLTEIAERFLVTGRSVGVTNRGLNHIGCLEGQPHSTTVSYVSKRLSFGLDPSGRVLSEYFADKAPIPKVRIDS